MIRRRGAAVAAAVRACAALEALDVRTAVIGSLAKGTFGPSSDIDILVRQCPRHLKYAIEGVVEDALCGFEFDVIYEDELKPATAARWIEGAIDARQLR